MQVSAWKLSVSPFHALLKNVSEVAVWHRNIY